jgi:hypothetical protein
MYFYNNGPLETVYVISTAKNGVSQVRNSHGTPLGLHQVTDKIGENAPWGTVFIGRQNMGKVFYDYDDWMTKGYVVSRILRLKGLQEGYNVGVDCDTYLRCIYIHGIANEKKVGTPCTGGCIGMLNRDVIGLFQKINPGSLLLIAG